MEDLEKMAIQRLQTASQMSLKLYKQPLVITYSGGKDSDVLLHLAEKSEIPFEVLHSLTTADAPETVHHVHKQFKRLEDKGIKCVIDKHIGGGGYSHNDVEPHSKESDASYKTCPLLLFGVKRNRRQGSVHCNWR